MDSTLLRKVAGLAIAAVLVFALLYYFAVSQVVDTQTPEMARAMDTTLARGLEKGSLSRVTMARTGKGAGASRLYTARFRPSAPVAADKAAVGKLCERAADIVIGYLDGVKGSVIILTIAEDAAGAVIVERAFQRDTPEADLAEIPMPPRAPEPSADPPR